MPSFKGSLPPGDQTWVSCIAGGFFTAEPLEKPLHTRGWALSLGPTSPTRGKAPAPGHLGLCSQRPQGLPLPIRRQNPWTLQLHTPGSNITHQWADCSNGMYNITNHQMQTKTTMRYHLTPVRMAFIKGITNNKCWWGCGKKGILLYCLWESKLTWPFSETQYRDSSIIKDRSTIWSSNPTPGYLSEENKNTNSKKMYATSCSLLHHLQ